MDNPSMPEQSSSPVVTHYDAVERVNEVPVPFSLGFFDTITSILISPRQTFEAVAVGQSVPVKGFLSAMGLFATVTVAMAGADVIWKADRSIFHLGFGIPLALIGAFFGAVYLSSILSAASHCFAGQTRFRQTLSVLFLASAPWLFYVPIAFLKSGLGFLGNVVGMLLGMALWAWSVVLFAMGVKAVYRLTLERTLLFLTLPLSMTLVFSLWLSDLFTRFGQILP